MSSVDKEMVLSYLKDLAYATTGRYIYIYGIVILNPTKLTYHCTSPLEAKFEETWRIIKMQPWYAMNQKLQDYLESEWMSCSPVSTCTCVLC